jgi:hypothetical protein
MAEPRKPPPPDERVITEKFAAICIKQPIGDIYVGEADSENNIL